MRDRAERGGVGEAVPVVVEQGQRLARPEATARRLVEGPLGPLAPAVEPGAEHREAQAPAQPQAREAEPRRRAGAARATSPGAAAGPPAAPGSRPPRSTRGAARG